MSYPLEFDVFRTGWGWIGALASPDGLRRLTLPYPTVTEALRMMRPEVESAVNNPETFRDLADRLDAYFSGSRVIFEERLDLSQRTEFERSVWEVACRIPFGKTRSYGWISGEIGRPRASRAVGQALGRNPLPVIIPCHRVVAGNGTLCGYGGGLPTKKRLLDLEARVRSPLEDNSSNVF